MEEFKIQIFKNEQPDKLFQFTTLNREDSTWVGATILKLAGISEILTETGLLYNSLFKFLTKEILYENEISSIFLKEVLTTFDISPDSVCFVFWDYESYIDLFKVEELTNNWDYIWYDKSDEAMILYFPSKEKIILVTDHGLLKSN